MKTVRAYRKRSKAICASTSSHANDGEDTTAAPLAAKSLTPTASSSLPAAPWEITRYLTKKKGRPIDKQGNIIDSLETTADWFTWTDDTKLILAADVLSPKIGLPADILLQNVASLGHIIPGGPPYLKKMKPADLVTLASKIETVPAKLIALREALPPCIDVARLISVWPDVLLLPVEGEYSVRSGYQAVLDQFQTEIGEDGVHKMLKTTPQLLDLKILVSVLRGAGHLMPLRQLATSLARYEDYWMQFQTLKNQPRNDYDDTLNDDVYEWKKEIMLFLWGKGRRQRGGKIS